MATYTGYVTMSAAFTITGDFDHIMDAEEVAEALVVIHAPQGVVWDDDMEFDVSVYED